MAETKKLTQKDYFNMIIELAEKNNRKDLVDFCNTRIEVLARKNSGDRKETKTQIENKGIKNNILELISNEKQQVKDITALYNTKYETNLSINKVSALIRQLLDEKKVLRTEEKGKAYFTLA